MLKKSNLINHVSVLSDKQRIFGITPIATYDSSNIQYCEASTTTSYTGYRSTISKGEVPALKDLSLQSMVIGTFPNDDSNQILINEELAKSIACDGDIDKLIGTNLGGYQISGVYNDKSRSSVVLHSYDENECILENFEITSGVLGGKNIEESNTQSYQDFVISYDYKNDSDVLKLLEENFPNSSIYSKNYPISRDLQIYRYLILRFKYPFMLIISLVVTFTTIYIGKVKEMNRYLKYYNYKENDIRKAIYIEWIAIIVMIIALSSAIIIVLYDIQYITISFIMFYLSLIILGIIGAIVVEKIIGRRK